MDKQPMSDERAMELITEALSVPQWSADTLDHIAEIVCANGRTITSDDDDDE